MPRLNLMPTRTRKKRGETKPKVPEAEDEASKVTRGGEEEYSQEGDLHLRKGRGKQAEKSPVVTQKKPRKKGKQEEKEGLFSTPRTRIDVNGVLLDYSQNFLCLVSKDHCASLVSLPEHEVAYTISMKKTATGNQPNKRRRNSVALSFLLTDGGDSEMKETSNESKHM